jgi:6-phosphogluconolactonase (cycloisomerase 2 family)
MSRNAASAFDPVDQLQHEDRRLEMNKFRFGLSVLLASACAVLAVAGTASAKSGPSSGVVGHVYVNDNTGGVNTIGAFERHANGTLTPAAGSPFPTDGVGTGNGLASQGSLQQSSDGRYLLAVDAGSNQISVLRIGSGGSLKRVGQPVSSNGVNPVSIAVYGDLVYVANAGTATSSGGTNYTGFTLNHGGHLRPLAHSTVTLPDASQPGDVLFSPDGRKLVGTRVATSLIDSFTVDGHGQLTAAPSSPLAAQGLGPFGSEFRPTNAGQLYVSNAHDGTNAGTVSAFAVGANGALTSIGASPFPNNQTAPCWVEISHDGRYLFAVNTASRSVSSYSISTGGSLALLQSTPVNAAATPEDARLSPDGRTLWVVDPTADAVSGFTVNGGTLTELATSPTAAPAGAAPAGIVVTSGSGRGKPDQPHHNRHHR